MTKEPLKIGVGIVLAALITGLGWLLSIQLENIYFLLIAFAVILIIGLLLNYMGQKVIGRSMVISIVSAILITVAIYLSLASRYS